MSECRRIKRCHVVTPIARHVGRDVIVRFRRARAALGVATGVGASAGAGDDARMIIGTGEGGEARMALITRRRGDRMVG